jgi:hypothetical protein
MSFSTSWLASHELLICRLVAAQHVLGLQSRALQ